MLLFIIVAVALLLYHLLLIHQCGCLEILQHHHLHGGVPFYKTNIEVVILRGRGQFGNPTGEMLRNINSGVVAVVVALVAGGGGVVVVVVGLCYIPCVGI